MSEDHVLVTTDDGIRTITLNRPDARNALSLAVRQQLKDLFEQAGTDVDVAVLVITGTDPAFCGGVDIKELGTGGGREGRAEITDPASALRAVPKPVLGAINGVCITGGLELALGCDVLIASERARFADTHVKIGFVPAWGMTAALAQAVGTRKAIELSLSGRFVEAEEAFECGLVNQVVPHEDLMPRTYGLAAAMRDADPDALHTVLSVYRTAAGAPFDDAFAIEAEAFKSWMQRRAGR